MIVFELIKTPKGYYVYDRDLNSIIRLSKYEFDHLNNIKNGNDDQDNQSMHVLLKLQERGFLKDSILEKIEHPETSVIDFFLKTKLQKLTLQLTQNCNLRCDYCAYSGKYNQRIHNSKSMSMKTIIDAIDFALIRCTNSRKLDIGFYGGEPLLEFEKIKRTIAYIKDKYSNHNISYSITTNGTLFTDEIIEFIVENDINVLVSLDGPREMHNRSRLFANGHGSFDKIISNLKNFKKNYPEFFHKISFNTVIPPGNDYKCINDFFTGDEIFSDNNLNKATVSVWNSKDEIIYDDRYHLTYKYEYLKVLLAGIGLYSKEKVSKFFWSDILAVERFHNGLGKRSISKVSHPGGPCLPGVNRPMVNYKGDIYPCEKVSETSEAMKIGNIYSGFDTKRINDILNIGKLSETECKECWNFVHCGLCVTSSVDGNSLSKKQKMMYCNSSKRSTRSMIYTVCVLNELGYNFKEGYLNDFNINDISS